ncbi:MAG: hypothetical protein EOO42_17140 [Flavobacteriales bacterium]|nr:MAG: hypothetical protein EOO42_17140 [Flavobacteriales bacterium]
MKLFIIPLLLAFVSCGNVKSEENPELKKTIETFFLKYATNSSQALDYIFQVNQEVSSDQLNELKDKLSNVNSLAGKYHGYENLTIKKATPSFIYMSYLVKHDRPVRFVFMFYKANDKWSLYKFKFDDQIGTELEESGKIFLTN